MWVGEKAEDDSVFARFGNLGGGAVPRRSGYRESSESCLGTAGALDVEMFFLDIVFHLY